MDWSPKPNKKNKTLQSIIRNSSEPTGFANTVNNYLTPMFLILCHVTICTCLDVYIVVSRTQVVYVFMYAHVFLCI